MIDVILINVDFLIVLSGLNNTALARDLHIVIAFLHNQGSISLDIFLQGLDSIFSVGLTVDMDVVTLVVVWKAINRNKFDKD